MSEDSMALEFTASSYGGRGRSRGKIEKGEEGGGAREEEGPP